MKQRLLRGTALATGGAVAGAAVSFARNLLIAKTMGPAAFGLWNVCLLLRGLALESHLGALSALGLDAPIHRGAGRAEEARRVERTALAGALVLGVAAATVAGVLFRGIGGPPVAAAAVLLGATIVLQQVLASDIVLLRARREFLRVALVQGAFALAHLGGLVLFLPGRYITGALLAWVTGLAVAVLAARPRLAEPIPLPGPRDLRGLGALLRRGLPAYLVGLAMTVYFQSDRWVVAGLLGDADLGYYSILVWGGTALVLVPDTFSAVLWPFAGERFGRSGERPEALASYAGAVLGPLALFLGALLLGALAFMDALVAWKIPFYAPALPSLRLYLAGMFLLSLALPLRYLLVTAGFEGRVLGAQVAALVVAVGLEVAAVLAGYGLPGVALGSAVGSAVLLGMLLYESARRLGLGGHAVRLGLEAVGLLALALVVDGVTDRLAAPPATAAGAAVRLGVPTLLCAAAGVFLLRRRGAVAPGPAEGWAGAASPGESS